MRLENSLRLLFSSFWIAVSAPAFAATELLIVVVKDTSGVASIHYRDAKDCDSFLIFFKYNQDNDIPTLYEAPNLKGVVTEAYCVGKDERIRGAYGYTYRRLSK